MTKIRLLITDGHDVVRQGRRGSYREGNGRALLPRTPLGRSSQNVLYANFVRIPAHDRAVSGAPVSVRQD